jgi:hypothetical protein
MANEYLRRTPTSTGNQRVFTISVWIKRGASGTYGIFGAGDGASGANSDHLWLNGDALSFSAQDGTNFMTSTPLLRDVGSWSHYHYIHKTDDAVAADRGQFFVNGVRLRDASSTTFSINQVISWMNKAGAGHAIGARNRSTFQSFMNGEMCDMFFVDGQALTPDVFGFYKQGKGYISAGSTQATDFRPGQWVPKTPRVIKTEINRRGGFGVNGFYLPMNDSSNFGADFHTTPNSIITLKGEDLPQPRNGAPTTTDAYVSQLREDPYKDNLVLALPFVSGGLNSGFGDYAPSIKGSGTQKTFTTNGNVAVANTSGYYGSGAYFDGNGDYLRTSTNISDFQFGTGDFTIETWLWKPTNGVNNYDGIITLGTSGNSTDGWFLEASSTRGYVFHCNTTQLIAVNTSPNTSQWNHLAVCRKGNTTSMYLNGAAIGINTNAYTVPSTATTLDIGAYAVGTGNYWFNGYIQDLRVYKGVAKYKGGFDVPRPYTPVGIATWRAVPDTTANNFATMNKLYNSSSGNVVLADGNLTYTGSQFPSYGLSQSTIGVSTSKWYWEFRIGSTVPNLGIGVMRPGISTSSAVTNPENSFITGVDGGIAFYHGIANRVYYWTGSAQTFVSYTLPACTTGDIVSIALDLTGGNNSKIYFAKNGTWGESGDPATGTNPVGLALSGTYAPAVSIGAAGASTGYFNFGQNPTFSGNTTAGTFTDTNGKGLFKYQPPSGFLALCEDNLPTPAISDPGKHFKTVLYTGTGASRGVVGVGFTPDLVWVKSRTDTNGHGIYDSVRGAQRTLSSNSTAAESINPAVNSFDVDGFSLGNSSDVNGGANYTAWCWRAGAGTTSTNTNGSITSVVSANQDAGFSIVSWTGNGSSTATVGHGLGKTPAFLISKARSGTNDWWVVHKSGNGNLQLNTTSALITSGGSGGSMGFPSTLTNTTFTFTAGSSNVNNVNASGTTYVTYCWAEIEGFSKFGSYIGNNSTDGPFVYCGFKPAWLMIKNTSAASQWRILDSSRDSVNPASRTLRGNDVNIEDSGIYNIDFLSNGFKLRATGTDITDSGNVYIFAAWAESPFSYSNSK